MNYGADQGVRLGQNIGNGIGSERPAVSTSWLFSATPLRERLADI